MEVKLRVNKDGNFLEIAVLIECHNHECDKVCCIQILSLFAILLWFCPTDT